MDVRYCSSTYIVHATVIPYKTFFKLLQIVQIFENLGKWKPRINKQWKYQ